MSNDECCGSGALAIASFLFPDGWIELSSIYPLHSDKGYQTQGCRHHAWRRLISWIGHDRIFTEFIEYLQSLASGGDDVSFSLETMQNYLRHPRSQVFFYWWLIGVGRDISDARLAVIIGENLCTLLKQWGVQDMQDVLALEVVREWHRLPGFSDVMNYKGVPLGTGMEYGLMTSVLENYFHALGPTSHEQ